MSNFIAGVVGALVGAIVAYMLGVKQKSDDTSRKKKAAATALLVEVYWIANVMGVIRDTWSASQLVVKFPMNVHDRFVDYIEYLDAGTIYAVLDFSGTTKDILAAADILREGVKDPDGVRARIKWLADIGLMKAVVAQDALLAEGAETPVMVNAPRPEEVERLLGRLRALWHSDEDDKEGASAT